MSERTRVVVIGGGFAGLACARRLATRDRDGRLAVTLIDKRNHHTFQPLLYQVATAGLQPQDVGHPLRPMFRRRGTIGRGLARGAGDVRVRLGEVVDVDREQQVVLLDDGSEVPYDRLVVAAGARTADFGTPGVREHAYELKSIPQALALRDHVLERFELADHEQSQPDPALLTFVVVGGGPTGVETAGALAELVSHVIGRDQPQLDLDRVRIVLVEMLDRLLPPFHPDSSAATEAALHERGVELLLGRSVAAVHEDHVELEDGETLATQTLVWVAGVEGESIGAQLGAETTRGGRVEVTPVLTLADDDRVHVIGDVAAARDEDGELLPQLAPVALQQGRYVADVLLAEAEGHSSDEPFRYLDKGTMATIGRNDAVAELPFGIRFSGFPAWLSWLGLHLFFLVGFRNRVAVLLSWLWNYVTYDRSARLILGRGHRHDEGTPTD